MLTVFFFLGFFFFYCAKSDSLKAEVLFCIFFEGGCVASLNVVFCLKSSDG